VKALLEAESYPGTSIVIAYSPCIAHGYDLSFSLDQQKLASESGYWPLYRFDPRRIATGETPLLMDTAQIKSSIAQFMRNEARFRMVEQQDAPRFLELLAKAEREVKNRFQVYENLAKLTIGKAGVPPAPLKIPAAPIPTPGVKA
jgi:pyruvate-ferredoxin/flavodoxin oxidoreductase